jgi:hypothetical protein
LLFAPWTCLLGTHDNEDLPTGHGNLPLPPSPRQTPGLGTTGECASVLGRRTGLRTAGCPQVCTRPVRFPFVDLPRPNISASSEGVVSTEMEDGPAVFRVLSPSLATCRDPRSICRFPRPNSNQHYLAFQTILLVIPSPPVPGNLPSEINRAEDQKTPRACLALTAFLFRAVCTAAVCRATQHARSFPASSRNKTGEAQPWPGESGLSPSSAGVAGAPRDKKRAGVLEANHGFNLSGPPYSCGQWAAIEIQETGSPTGSYAGRVTGDGVETGFAGALA